MSDATKTAADQNRQRLMALLNPGGSAASESNAEPEADHNAEAEAETAEPKKNAAEPAARRTAPATKAASNPISRLNMDDDDEDDEAIEIPASELNDFWSEGWHFVRIVAAKREVSKSSGNKMILATYRAMAGPMQGAYKTDYWSLEGKGVAKTGNIATALGLRDPNTGNVRIGGVASLIDRELWIRIIHREETYTNKSGVEVTTTRDEIEFPNGYAARDKFEVPKEGDLFAESGSPISAG